MFCKTPIWISLTIMIFYSCSVKTDHPPRDDFKVTAMLGGSYRFDTSQIVFIVGKMHNRSEDTLSFLSMTCSWDDSWKTSSPNFEIVKNICYSNVPILIRLGPNETMINYLPVRILKPFEEVKEEKFQLGFNLVRADTIEFEKSTRSLTETNNLYWSDTLQLNQLFRFNTIKIEK